MKNLLFYIFTSVVFTSASADPLSASDRKEFIESLKNSCVKRQTAAAENANLPVAAISDYCTCVAEQSADALTAEDKRELDRTGDPVRVLQVTQQAYRSCGTAIGSRLNGGR
jgi:hypothetical protein